nr:alpha/beta hydrolase-fold protein [Paenibacillus oenotherae]
MKSKFRFTLIWVLLAAITAGCMQESEASIKKENSSKQVSAAPVVDEISFKDWRKVLPSDAKHTIVGNVTIAEEFPMLSLNTLRRIWVYLPPNYNESNANYPVLYMHDGQNLFDDSTSFSGEWGIDETMERLAAKNPDYHMIVVGIDNGGDSRLDEYTPFNNGGKYVEFLANELKPYIDKHYRTQSDPGHTYISGSSLGGYISLFAGLERPDVFGNIMAFSTVYEIGRGAFFVHVNSLSSDRLAASRFYLDIGAKEEEQFVNVVRDNESMLQLLEEKGVSKDRKKLIIDQDGKHIEPDWRERFPAAMEWILNGD